MVLGRNDTRIVDLVDPLHEGRDHGDLAGFVVFHRRTGRLTHFESFEAGRISDERLADLIVANRERLEARYPPARFAVEGGLFNSLAAFRHFFPEVAEALDTGSMPALGSR